MREQIDRGGRLLLWIGLAIAFCGAVLAGSGVFLVEFYKPTEAQAWQDIYQLHTGVSYGLFIRNIHRWTAIGYALVVFGAAILSLLIAVVHRGPARRWLFFTGPDNSRRIGSSVGILFDRNFRDHQRLLPTPRLGWRIRGRCVRNTHSVYVGVMAR
jgi:hypothetical protein